MACHTHRRTEYIFMAALWRFHGNRWHSMQVDTLKNAWPVCERAEEQAGKALTEVTALSPGPPKLRLWKGKGAPSRGPNEWRTRTQSVLQFVMIAVLRTRERDCLSGKGRSRGARGRPKCPLRTGLESPSLVSKHRHPEWSLELSPLAFLSCLW